MSHRAIVQATEGHRAFGQLLRRDYSSDEHLIVERDGFPVAVLMSYQEYQQLSRQQGMAAFERLGRELGRASEKQGIAEEEPLADLKEARKAVHEESYGRQSD